jgi:hypothetical protein
MRGYDVGAHVGEQRPGKRTGNEVRKLDDPNSSKRLCHRDKGRRQRAPQDR